MINQVAPSKNHRRVGATLMTYGPGTRVQVSSTCSCGAKIYSHDGGKMFICYRTSDYVVTDQEAAIIEHDIAGAKAVDRLINRSKVSRASMRQKRRNGLFPKNRRFVAKEFRPKFTYYDSPSMAYDHSLWVGLSQGTP